MSAAQSVTAAAAATDDASHLFATAAGIGWHAARIAALIDPTFLAELGWDAAGLVLFPPAEHPLLGRPVCRAEGCSTTATNRARICASCRRRLAEHGLGDDELASLPARAQPGEARMPARWTAARGSGSRPARRCAVLTWISSKR